jgi:hypothetical protein
VSGTSTCAAPTGPGSALWAAEHGHQLRVKLAPCESVIECPSPLNAPKDTITAAIERVQMNIST